MDKEKIIKAWVDRILAGYPVKPVFEVVDYVEDAARKIFNGILTLHTSGELNADVDDAIDDLMRFLATDRNLSPGESIKLISELRDMMADGIGLRGEDRLKFNLRVEELMFRAFNAYMACREKIFELRLKEKDRDIEIMRKIIEYSDKAKF
ncbi:MULTISPECIES: hypothetical protein [unclassified Archaeoglobus]|jgi:hypothetical protein|uniref:hypothetical protein n=1 Tax=unclassified Archaeoglobus TaxID=2643606 RepID=UPI0025BD7E29|nr:MULTISPECIES: hypothetical protein [unclassified Archaeoglobus]